MSYIIEVHARQILDSRGNPTVEVDVVTDDGALAARQCQVAPVPVFMKPRLRDNDKRNMPVRCIESSKE